MKLVRFIAKSFSPQPMWGVLEHDTVFGVSLPILGRTGQSWRLPSVELLAPADPSKIVCVGKNYAAHAAEMGGEVPIEPGLFLKGANTLAVSGETIAYPAWTDNFHFEGELGLVLKTRAHKVSEEKALSHVLGYTCALDLTARDKQKSDLQWFRAKSADKFLPFGPYLETALEPQNTRIQTRVNGETKQDSTTDKMIYGVAKVISYVSQFMTLQAGDVIITGTPDGVGPLQPGDTVEVEIDGIGVLETKIGRKELE
jgi:2-keto-4-pentenoate hydratase/2-oxohepta-3-ene-1,7-dioic acid hydratase in catechol pathway